MSALKAAASHVRIPAEPEMVIGGGIGPMYAESQEGELRATAVVLIAETKVCIVSCDVLGVPKEVADRAARAIEAKAGIPFDNILITATHTHHAPTTFTVHGYTREEKFTADLEGAIVEAACRAAEYLQGNPPPNESEAEFLFAEGWETTVGRNSRLRLKDGTIAWCRHSEDEAVRPTGPFDPSLPLIVLRRPSGKLVAGLFGHGNHNIGFLEHACSPGFYGLAAQEAERRNGAPFLFLPGAIGSSHPHDAVPVSERIQRLGAAIDEAMSSLRPGLRGPVICIKEPFSFRTRSFDETREEAAVRGWCERWFEPDSGAKCVECFRRMRADLAARAGQERETWLQVIRLGDVAIVGVPGEMFASLGLEIRRRSPLRHTIVVGLANDEIGYIPDSEGMDLGGYQVWTGFHSTLEKGTGEAMVNACVELLNRAAGITLGEPRIREMCGGDGPALQEFYNTLDSSAKVLFRPLGWNAILPDCEHIVGSAVEGRRYDVVVEQGGRILGWAFVGGIDEDYPGFGICVSEELRGRGFGVELMENVVEFTRRRGSKGMSLTVVQTNDRARALYEKFGFRVTGTRTGSDGLVYYDMRVEFHRNS